MLKGRNMVSADDLAVIVWHRLEAAVEAMTALTESTKTAGERAMIQDVPRFARLDLGSAANVHCAVLFVDIRGSTRRAKRIGPVDTYFTMHAFLPAMAYVVQEYDGFIVGFRGDGLCAAFGINERGQTAANADDGVVVRLASSCGQCMIESVDRVVNRCLDRLGVSGDLRIGVGDVIVTRIGLPLSYDITAYGDAVNNGSKLSDKSDGAVYVSSVAGESWPSSPEGRVLLQLASQEPPAYRVIFPDSQMRP